MAWDNEFRIKGLDVGERPQPSGRIDIVAVHERNAAVLNDVASEQHAVRFVHHHDVASGMARARVNQREALPAEVEYDPLLKSNIGRNDACIAVDPRKQRFPTLVEPLIGSLIRGLLVLPIFAGSLLGDDDGARTMVLECLQSVNVIGMIMTDDDVAYWLITDLSYLL